MPQWEYATQVIDIATNVPDELNKAGIDGWEVASAVLCVGRIQSKDGYASDNPHVMCVFKRPLLDADGVS